MTVDKKGMLAWDTVVLRLDEHGVPHPDRKSKSPSGSAGRKEIVMKSNDG